MTPGEKRLALEHRLRAFNSDLIQRYGKDAAAGDPCLLLGRHYAESPYLYFSLNPGFARDGSPLDPSSSADLNVPFRNGDELRRQYVYLHNCQRFFEENPPLNAWINNGITSAFLVPWRTPDTSSLYRLNRKTEGRVFAHAGVLVTQIIRDHEARLLIAAGKSSLTLLNDIGVLDTAVLVDRYLGPGGSYQWSRCETKVGGYPLTILQIPHFSRANSAAKMRDFGYWLAQQIDTLAPNDVLSSKLAAPRERCGLA